MLTQLTAQLQQSVNILHKQDIQTAARALEALPAFASAGESIRIGDDCAAIPDGDRYLLLAAEGMSPSFVREDPWFAGWCAVNVNISDVAAMGGTPLALVDAFWSPTDTNDINEQIWTGMTAAARAYQVPIVGGHSNHHSPYLALATAILGQAQQLITSFDATPGDTLLIAIDMRGSFYKHYPFWNAATQADPADLQQTLKILPYIANQQLCKAGKDISMGGIIGTLLMLAETSQVGAILTLDTLIKPDRISWEKWLTSFPSYGYLLSVPPENTAKVIAAFQSNDITCTPAGSIISEPVIYLENAEENTKENAKQRQPFWHIANTPLTGFASPQ